MPLRIIDTSYIKRRYLDIPYGEISASQKIDIYLPDNGDGPFPVIISIHGGAFLKGDKRDNQLLPMLEGIKRNYAVVSINYRLSGEACFPANIDDVKAAVRFLRSHAEEYKLDTACMAAWGGSAGGNLSALLGLSADRALIADDAFKVSCAVHAVVDWFGPTDFLQMDAQLIAAGFNTATHNENDSPESKLIGSRIVNAPNRVQAANPINYITVEAPPFLIQHGTHDKIVPLGQSQLLYDALTSINGNSAVIFEKINGAGHGDPAFETTENVDRVFRFLDSILKK